MGSIMWGQEIAEVYDANSAADFEPLVLDPIVDFLEELARGGPVLEFAVGTGRVALPLSQRGISVHGIELSPHMAEQLLAKPGAEQVPVTVGDMTSTRVPGTFRLVYLVANTIMNVTTQDEQIAVFDNATAHLEPGGCFVVEVGVPRPGKEPTGIRPPDPTMSGSTLTTTWSGRSLSSHHWIEVEWSSGPPLRPIPLRLAVRARSDGEVRRFPTPGPLGGLGPRAVHVREQHPSRRVREALILTQPPSRRV